MSLEKQVLAAVMLSRSAYDVFERIGQREELSPIGTTVYRAVSEYYERDPDVRSVDRSVIEDRLLRQVANSKHEGALSSFIGELPRDVSTINVEHDIRDLHRASVGRKLSLALANGAAQNEVAKLIADYDKAGDSESFEGKSRQAGLVDVLNTIDLTQGDGMSKDFIKLWPRSLNDKLDGGALRGHHILVFARPETGKTAFAVNLCAGFLHQKLNVLYVANEEPLADVRDRLRARLLKISKAALRQNPAEAAARLAKAEGLGRIVLDDEAQTFPEIRSVLKGFPADVIIIDQLRNVRVNADSNKTSQLEAAANEARALGKQYKALVISITQAGDSATGHAFIDMSDIDNSKTGIPGAVDLIIGIGADDPMRNNGLLGISLSKNKLGGTHDKFTVSVNFATGVIE